MYPYESSVGAFMIGTFLCLFIGGVTTTQAWSYYTNFKGDRFFWIVSVVVALDTIHTIISCNTVYFWGVVNFDNPSALQDVPWSFAVEPMFTGVIACIVQLFYAYRVYVVSQRRRVLPAVIATLAVLSAGFSLGATYMVFALGGAAARFQEWEYGLVTWLCSAAAADILVTGSLVYYLHDHGATDRSKSIVSSIIRNTIETNGLTCLVAISNVVLFCGVAGEWHVIPQLQLAKLYLNSLLVSLNARNKISTRNDSVSTTNALPQFGGRGGKNDNFGSISRTDRSVLVTITQEMLDERGDMANDDQSLRKFRLTPPLPSKSTAIEMDDRFRHDIALQGEMKW